MILHCSTGASSHGPELVLLGGLLPHTALGILPCARGEMVRTVTPGGVLLPDSELNTDLNTTFVPNARSWCKAPEGGNDFGGPGRGSKCCHPLSFCCILPYSKVTSAVALSQLPLGLLC